MFSWTIGSLPPPIITSLLSVSPPRMGLRAENVPSQLHFVDTSALFCVPTATLELSMKPHEWVKETASPLPIKLLVKQTEVIMGKMLENLEGSVKMNLTWMLVYVSKTPARNIHVNVFLPQDTQSENGLLLSMLNCRKCIERETKAIKEKRSLLPPQTMCPSPQYALPGNPLLLHPYLQSCTDWSLAKGRWSQGVTKVG